MKRGDLVTVALNRDYGKPRPALIVQSDAFQKHDSVLVAPLTSLASSALDAPLLRVLVEPTVGNGLRKRSAVMADKLTAVARIRIGSRVGTVDAEVLDAVNLAMRGLLDI